MCEILSRFSTIKIAKEDIIVYKYVNISRSGIIFSPIKFFNYKLKEKYITELEKVSIFSLVRKTGSGFYSYDELPPDFYSYKEIPLRLFSYKIVKCIIPKGSKYYRTKYKQIFKNFFGFRSRIYISDQIIIDEIL